MKYTVKTAQIIFSISALFLLGACSMNNSGQGISGTIENTEEAEINLYQAVNKNLKLVSTAVIDENGSFAFNPGESLDPDFYYLGLGEDKKNTLVVFTDSTECLSLKIDADKMGSPIEFSGSENTKIYHDFQSVMTPLLEDLNRIKKELNNRTNTKTIKDSLKTEYEKNQKLIVEKSKTFIDENEGNPICLAGLSHLNFEENMSYYDKALKSTEKEFGHTILHKMVSIQVANVKSQIAAAQSDLKKQKESVGQSVPDISMSNPDGETLQLSDLHGKVVLVDFWASWCGPCRRENPNVVKAYEKYNKDGFEVFSISLDSDLNRWMAAIEKDNLTWPNHVSDLKGWKNAAARKYGVKGIPHTILLDREGKVVGVKLRGAQLDKELEKLFGY